MHTCVLNFFLCICCTILPCTVLCCITLYYTPLYCIVLYCTALYCTALHYTVLYCAVLNYTVLHCTVLWCTVLYCTVLYCAVLYCTVLHPLYHLISQAKPYKNNPEVLAMTNLVQAYQNDDIAEFEKILKTNRYISDCECHSNR